MMSEERRPLVFRVNTNPNWNSNIDRSSVHNPFSSSNSSSNDQRTRNLKSPSGKAMTRTVRCACLCILLYMVFERIAFHGLVGNLVLFLNKTPFLWVSYDAQSAIMFFFGIAFLVAPFGGWLADSYFGRFRMMIIAFVIYLSGYILLPFISDTDDMKSKKNNSDSDISVSKKLPEICAASGNISTSPGDSPFEQNCAWLVYLILLLLATADGICKSNLGPFGSDQFANSSSSTQLSFFNWYYWCLNFGSFIGLGVMTYVEQQISFHLGYIICTACLGVGILIFIAGRLFYTCRPADGSVITNIFKIIKEAWKRKRQRNNLKKLASNRQGLLSEEVDSSSNPDEKISFLDYAKHQHGGIFHNSLVNDVKKLKMILAVFASLVPYWLVYLQMETTFLFQALHMKLTFSDNQAVMPLVNVTHTHPMPFVHMKNATTIYKPQLVAAWFTLFDVLFVIILLPLFDRVIYPRMARAGYPFTFAKRIVLGMVFSILAMMAAGVVETYRLRAFWPDDNQPCFNASLPQIIANTEYEAADMSVLWQIPQYALIGISEVFASVASLQFAVSVAPKSTKALITGLYYAFIGIASLLGMGILFIFSHTKLWFFDQEYGNINCRMPCSEKHPYVRQSCHLDYYFFFLGGLEVIGLVIFLFVSYKFGLDRDKILALSRPVVSRNLQSGTSAASTSSTSS